MTSNDTQIYNQGEVLQVSNLSVELQAKVDKPLKGKPLPLNFSIHICFAVRFKGRRDENENETNIKKWGYNITFQLESRT